MTIDWPGQKQKFITFLISKLQFCKVNRYWSHKGSLKKSSSLNVPAIKRRTFKWGGGGDKGPGH